MNGLRRLVLNVIRQIFLLILLLNGKNKTYTFTVKGIRMETKTSSFSIDVFL